MTIYSWNVNGIRAVINKGLFQSFIDKEKPDILGLQEIKANSDQINLDIKGYYQYYYPAERAGYSGTAVLSKIKPKKVIQGLPNDLVDRYKLDTDSYGNPNQEGRVLTIELKEFFFVNVYTPNTKDDLSRLDLRHKKWDPAFLEFIQRLEKSKPVIFCGDLNVAHKEDDLANPKTNFGKKGFTLEERTGIDNIIKAGYVDSFRIFHQGNGYYTWWSFFANSRSRNVGWRIDYLMVSKKIQNKIKKSDIHPNILGSDHCPISIEVDINE
jgi:exodeoxyribonuclease-3